MKILIDADACPVVDIAVRLAKEVNKECVIICATAHYIEREGAVTVTVEKGADSVDFKLVNTVKEGDIAVTQDYGLAGAAALMLFVIIFIVTMINLRISKKSTHY